MKLTYRTYSGGYTILADGIPWIVQTKDHIPYPRPSIENPNMDLSAKAHIDALLKINQDMVPEVPYLDLKSYYDLTKSNFTIPPETVDGWKIYQIQYSKDLLAEYLESNPLISDIHGGVSKKYSVTQEKQNQLTSITLMANSVLAQNEAIKNNPDLTDEEKEAMYIQYNLTWNSTGEPCETWELSELMALGYQINEYVKPLVTEQQYIEVAIKSKSTIEDIKGVPIDYANTPLSKGEYTW